MQFGMFMEFATRTAGSEAEAFREGLALAEAADAWGLDAAWLAEFHFVPDRSVLSSPITLAAAIAGRTQRLRIGFAVYVLPLNHPLRIAEEIATLDQVSGGRVDLGVGRSGFTWFYEGYSVPYAESQGRFDESMEVLRRAWRGERFSFEGEFYRVHDALLCPRPRQQPHPPLRMAATRGETFPRVGAAGLPIFVGLRGDSLDELAAQLASYRDAWHGAGHPGRPSAFLRLPLHAAATGEGAREEARATLVHYFRRQSELVANDAARRGDPPDSPRYATAARLASLEYDDILENRAIVGSAAEIGVRVEALRDILGIDGVVAELNPGGLLDEATTLESLRILAREVKPQFGGEEAVDP
ncbi:MAG: LLM class flavin-dependent oxidoreductase [Immundisolibacterales bacterium]|nr:LLM class flavin-dependent oxidoreductase [Immundisolibacterales bacterium]